MEAPPTLQQRRGRAGLWRPTELASVDAEIEKKAPARLFTQSHSPTTQGRGDLWRPTELASVDAEIEKNAPARLFLLNLIHPRREVVGVYA